MTPETAMLSPDRLPDLSTLTRANDDYAVVRRAMGCVCRIVGCNTMKVCRARRPAASG